MRLVYFSMSSPCEIFWRRSSARSMSMAGMIARMVVLEMGVGGIEVELVKAWVGD